MTEEEIFRRVTEVFRDLLDNDSILLQRGTTANDIEEWDSLAHISLIVAVEKEFNVKFDIFELKSLGNVGEMVDLIKLKI